jgi:hypothetical protein
MPADRPGQLPLDSNVSILAYLLERNGFAAGDKELSNDIDELKKVVIGEPGK